MAELLGFQDGGGQVEHADGIVALGGCVSGIGGREKAEVRPFAGELPER
jgi:hypothetical protein